MDKVFQQRCDLFAMIQLTLVIFRKLVFVRISSNFIQTRRERPKSAPYLRLKNIQVTTIGNFWEKNIFFSKKLYLKFFFEVAQCRKTQKEAIQAHSTFSTNRKLKKNARGYPLIKFENFRKKSHSAEKKPKGGTLWSHLYFWKH